MSMTGVQQLRQWRGDSKRWRECQDEEPSHCSQSENDRAAGYLASQSHAILSAMYHDDDDVDEMASAEIQDHVNKEI